MRLFAITSYKGTRYAGWQRQPNALSVQEVIETELSKFFNREITIYGAGRTDAGVSAIAQTFHFDVDVDEFTALKLIRMPYGKVLLTVIPSADAQRLAALNHNHTAPAP